MVLTVRALVVVLALAGPTIGEASAGFDHGRWDELLTRHVVALGDGGATAVDYAGMSDDAALLNEYLGATESVSREEFDAWPRDVQLAFLINVYNARTVELILTAWPDLDSIRDLGSLFRSPWKREFFSLFGEQRTLDEVEHGMIRGSGRYEEPRIHFAVNCASRGCPALKAEAYTGARLEQQLEAATRDFLSDREQNAFADGTLRISSIFDWYRSDFESGWREANSLREFLALYADALGLADAERRRLVEGGFEIAFRPYDWSLNGLPSS